MKIVIYAWSLDNGGAERVASLWANGFAEQGHKVSIVLDSLFTPIKYKVSPNVAIIRQYHPQKAIPSKLFKFILKKHFLSNLLEKIWYRVPQNIRKIFLANTLQKENPDVIITVLPAYYKRIKDALNAIGQNTPIIVTDHNPYERPEYAPLSVERIKEKFTDSYNYDFLTVLTEADKLVLQKRMDSSFMKKVYVLPNPLTYTPQVKIPPKEKTILAAGRLDDWHYKGFDLLLQAWSNIHRSFPDWKLKIAGGNDKSTLLKICKKLKIEDRVDFLGFVDIKKEYEKAEIFVLSSRYEGFGMVLTEAMSQGCACIACDYKGRQREIIENDNQGVICPTDNEEEIAKAISNIISNRQYRQKLQENAILRSKYYELPNIMARWNDIFERMGLIN